VEGDCGDAVCVFAIGLLFLLLLFLSGRFFFCRFIRTYTTLTELLKKNCDMFVYIPRIVRSNNFTIYRIFNLSYPVQFSVRSSVRLSTLPMEKRVLQ
jgi:hypothetical protein